MTAVETLTARATEPVDATSPARWVPTLYLAEGLPFVATMMTSVLMYKSLGLTDTQIAVFTSALAWPWSLKPLWSGAMETFTTKKNFVLSTQAAAGIGFALIAAALLAGLPYGWTLALFALIALCSATHDIAADGLYIESLDARRQARYIGFTSGFWNVGRIVAQGGLVTLAGTLEHRHGPGLAWAAVMALLAVLMLSLAAYHRRVLPAGSLPPAAPPGQALQQFREVAVAFLHRRHVYWGLAFVIFYRFAEGQAMKILPLFLRADRADGGLGLATDVVGVTYGTFGAVALTAGSIAGGFFAARLRLSRALLPLCLVFNLPYAAYVFLAWAQPTDLVVITAAVVVEWFGYGFGFVAVTLFMMQQMALGRFKMSHYAIATSAMNLGLILPGSWSGWLADRVGYLNFFLWVMASTLVSLVAAWLVPLKSEEELAVENRS
jgi:PAT family beta-lactamase induction signal transducer AmpG